MSGYQIQINGRRSELDADDAAHAARRAIMSLLMDDAIPRGATYEVLVDGAPYAVDVALREGRGSVVARAL